MSSSSRLHEEAVESRYEAAPAVAVVMGLQVVLALVSRAQTWHLWDFAWWLWLIPVVPEFALLLPLALPGPRLRLEQMGIRRETELVLLSILGAANTLLVIAVIASLVTGNERSGSQLLLKSFTVWGTNVVTFGLWYWTIDRGGPDRRLRAKPPPPDFQFPQMENPDLAAPGWRPHLVDYVYVSFTNALAFSPTDAMPLSRRAKLLMLFESSLSAVVILLVTARAVNIFK